MEEEKGEENFSIPPVEGSSSSPPGEGEPSSMSPSPPAAVEGTTVATGPPVESQMANLHLGDSSPPSSGVINLASDFAAASSAAATSAAPSSAAPSSAAPSRAATSSSSLDLTTTLQKMQLTLDAALDSAKVNGGILDAGAIEMMRALFPAGSGRAAKRPTYSRPSSGGASSSGGSSRSRRSSSSTQGSSKKPKKAPLMCTYEHCQQRKGHDVSTCWQKHPELRPKKKGKAPGPKPSTDDDGSDDE